MQEEFELAKEYLLDVENSAILFLHQNYKARSFPYQAWKHKRQSVKCQLYKYPDLVLFAGRAFRQYQSNARSRCLRLWNISVSSPHDSFLRNSSKENPNRIAIVSLIESEGIETGFDSHEEESLIILKYEKLEMYLRVFQVKSPQRQDGDVSILWVFWR
ncbi:hypothetical protein QYF36_025041 [Acer negundo]|nr:hypothetical protein QYF36_025041 [Acer negundo]